MFCFGTGVVEGPRSIPPSTSFQGRGTHFRSRRSSRLPTPCPFCRCPVSRLSRHIRRVHGAEASAVPPAGTPAQVPVAQAPQKTVNREPPLHPETDKINKGGLREQLEFGKSAKPATAPPPSARLVAAPFVTCPKCGCKLKKSKLAWHLQNVYHSKQDQPAPPALKGGGPTRRDHSGAGRPKAKPTAVRPEDLKNEVRQSQISRSTDASKDFAHSFRERGKYGSYPSHDDYGDEGKA